MMLSPRYLGDGVYAQVYAQVDDEDGYRIILTTGSHRLEDADNVIYLEPEVMKGVAKYIHDLNE